MQKGYSHSKNAFFNDKAKDKQNKWYTHDIWNKMNGLSCDETETVGVTEWCIKCIKNIYKVWGAKNFSYNSNSPNTIYPIFHEFLLNLQNLY